MISMRLLRPVALLGVLVFLVMILVSSLEMNLWQGLKAIADSWWGILTLVDVYAGLLLFALFVGWRERHAGITAMWVVLLLTLGNLASLAYVGFACSRCKTLDEVFRPVR